MSRTHKDSPKSKQVRAASRKGRERRISVRGVRRAEPDLRKLGRALIDLALAQAEADAEAQSADESPNPESADD
ncbi:MAG: hypothetical protein JWN95_446 [Frankiales bacterium]|nr:hypothetical protein [Frankiales bacterium]